MKARENHKGRAKFTPCLITENLEARSLCAVSVSIAGSGILKVDITGTDARQDFEIRSVSSTSNRILYSDGVELKFINLNLASVKGIEVNGSSRDNWIFLRNVDRSNFPNILDSPLSPKIIIRGNDGNDKLTGSEFADSINGGNGSDEISGLGGNDTLDVGPGCFKEVIRGGDGNDTVIATNFIDDSRTSFDGGAGSDTFRGKKPIRATFRNFP